MARRSLFAPPGSAEFCYDFTIMFRRFALLSLLCLLTAGGVRGQSTGAVHIDTDLRLLTVMTALNAAGFDVELGNDYHPVRQTVRNLAKQLDPALIARLKDFYQTHKRSESDDAQLSKYISLAVSLTAPPDFKATAREEYLPGEVRDVLGFADLLKEVFLQAKLTSASVELRPQYDAEINQLGPSIRDALVRTDAYLRIASGSVSARTMEILVELAAPKNSVNVRSDQDSYYVVLGQSTTSHIADIRHAYLHLQLDDVIALNSAKVNNGAALLQLIKGVPGVQPAYSDDFYKMLSESIIRAVEIRIDRMSAAKAKDSVDSYYRSGLLLTPFVYGILLDYEGQDSPFRNVIGKALPLISVGNEQNRFNATFMNIPATLKANAAGEIPQADPVAPPNPMRDLLKEAETALNSNDNLKARAAFEKVLAEHDRSSGAALYGLGLVASREGDSTEARGYFESATRSENIENSMKVWAYVYLARILDLECARERAVENYRQAVKLGDNTRNAQSAAQEGIKKPYGDACAVRN